MPYIFILYIYSVCRSVVSLSGACSVVTIGGMRGVIGGPIPILSHHVVNTETGELKSVLSGEHRLLQSQDGL